MAKTNLSVEEKTSNWEAKIHELLALKSIYCEEGEREIISPTHISLGNLTCIEPSDITSPDAGTIVIRVCIKLLAEQVTTHRLCLAVTFNLGSWYLQGAPTITEISSKQLPKNVTDSICEKVNVFIATLQPEPCLFEALEWIKDEALNLVVKDPKLLPDVRFTVRDSDSRTNTAHDHVVDKVIAHQTENLTPKDVCDKQTSPGGLPTTCHVCIAKLDHMRNEQKYLKQLNSWAKELSIYGKILHVGAHSIYTIFTGTSASSVSEFLKRWKTQNIDIDSQGRPCKEKLLSVLCQQELSDCVCSWSKATGRAPGLVMVHCVKSDMAAELNSDQDLLLQYS